MSWSASEGKQIWIENNFRKPDKMIDQLHVGAYLDQQRESVQRHGQCDGRCSHTELIEHYSTGRRVCPHTLQPCQSRRLASIINLFGVINGKRGS